MAARMSPADMLAMLQAGLSGGAEPRAPSVAEWRSE
jgi:hypothetical protein